MPKKYEHPFAVGDEFFLVNDDGVLIIHKIKCIRPLDNYEIYKVVDILDDWAIVGVKDQSGDRFGYPLHIDVAPPNFPYKDVLIQDGFPFEENCSEGNCPCAEI